MDITEERGIAYNKGYNKAIEDGRTHSEPSPKTREFMAEIDIRMQTIEEKLDLIPTRDEMKLVIKEAQQEVLKCVEEDSDKKYAPMWVKTLVSGMIGAVLLYVLNSILKTI